MASAEASPARAASAGGEGLFRALCVFLALAPWVILPGNLDASHRPQAAFVHTGALALFLAVLAGPVRQRRLAALSTPFDAPIVALLLFSGASLFWSVNRYEAVLAWMHWSACALVFWMIAAALRDESDARRLLQALFVSGVLISLLGLVQHAYGLTLLPQAEPPAATFVHKNVAAAFVVMTVPLGPTLLLHRPRSKLLIQYVAATAVMVSFVVVTFTRSAWLALAVQAALFAVLLARDRDLRIRWPAPRRVMATALTLAIVVASTVTFAVLGPKGTAAAWERVAEVWRAFGADRGSLDPDVEGVPYTSVQHRRAIWLNTLAMARDAPLLGVGLGNHDVVYPAYAWSAAPDRIFGERSQLDFAHNDYLQTLTELGVVGAGLSAWLLVALGRTLRRLWLREAAADHRALVLGAGLGIVGLLVDAAFSFPLQQALPPLLLMAYLGVLSALLTRFGWAAGVWRIFHASAGPRRLVPPLAVAVVAALLALAAWSHGRWLVADRHALRMARAERRADWPTALAEAAAAHRLDPGRREPLLVMGEAHLATGRVGQALPPLRELLATRPHDLTALGNLGLALSARGDAAAAGEAFRRVLRIQPRDARAHHELGAVLEQEGRGKGALEEYRLAARYAGRNAAYQHKWGVTALQAGLPEEAVHALRRALEEDPTRAASHKALGVVLFEVLGRRAEGEPHLRRALELDPSDRDAPRIRQLLDGGR
ncbi:MAG TPA: O-antigen ligase family protein [Vicinamibacteria bacterium]|nr:O-antigen ligase family protein [Vicinamibacteria bacterium]